MSTDATVRVCERGHEVQGPEWGSECPPPCQAPYVSAPTTRLADTVAIRKALEGVYGKSETVTSCAEYIALRLPEWLANEEDPLHELHLFIWCWFPGGGTAEIAAKAVLSAHIDGGVGR